MVFLSFVWYVMIMIEHYDRLLYFTSLYITSKDQLIQF